MLYGANTVGAVMGCLLAGFYLLRVFDMATATFVAAAINVTVGLVSFSLARRAPEHKSADEAKPVHRGWSLARLRDHRAFRRHRARRGSHLDAPARPDARRHGLHLLHHPGRIPGWASGSAAPAAPCWCATRRNPKALLGWSQMLLAGAVAWTAYMLAVFAALLAHQSAAFHQPLVHLPDRHGALLLGAPARPRSSGARAFRSPWRPPPA